jgi:hypothetical protein
MSKASTTEDRRYEVVYMDGVASMYRRPPEYTQGWLEFFRQNENGRHDRFAVRLFNRQYDEIAAALGLEFDLAESVWWASVHVEIAITGRWFYDTMFATGGE